MTDGHVGGDEPGTRRAGPTIAAVLLAIETWVLWWLVLGLEAISCNEGGRFCNGSIVESNRAIVAVFATWLVQALLIVGGAGHAKRTRTWGMFTLAAMAANALSVFGPGLAASAS